MIIQYEQLYHDQHEHRLLEIGDIFILEMHDQALLFLIMYN